MAVLNEGKARLSGHGLPHRSEDAAASEGVEAATLSPGGPAGRDDGAHPATGVRS